MWHRAAGGTSRPVFLGGFKMILRLACALVFGVMTTAAIADDLDFTKIKCKEFVSGSKDEIGTILTWLEGYYTKESDPPILFADKTVKDAKSLSAYCNAHPDNDIIAAAEAVMPAK